MAKRVTHRSQGRAETKLIHPHREWCIGIVLFLTIVVVGGVFNTHEHAYYNTLDTSVERVSVPIEEYRSNSIKQAIETYRTRAARFDAFMTAAPVQAAGTTTGSTTPAVEAGENEVSESETNETEGPTNDGNGSLEFE